MKKNLLLLAASTLVSIGAMATGYYHIRTTGTTSEYNMNQSTGTSAIYTGTGTAKANELFSPAVSLPFAFSFYGNAVTQFKASSSGYITFDVSQTTDVTSNTALPNASAPKNAIFAFWDNLRLQTITQGSSTFPSDIRTWTYGTAPNRVFVVQWRLTQTNDGSNATNVTYFAIRLYENDSHFDVVHNYGFGTFSATVGCQNSDASSGYSILSSPNQNFGGNSGSYDAAKSHVYSFYYGTQPAISLKLVKNATPAIASISNTSGISVAVDGSNYGSSTITGGKINYSVNNGAAVTTSFTTSVSPSGGISTITSTTKYVAQAADAGTDKTFKVWITEINGGADASDTLTFSVFINKGVFGTKNVFVEEGSGAWCGWCPDGHFRLHDILNANPTNVVGVVHHNNDGMATTEGNTINTAFATGYPYGVVDRVTFSDQEEAGLNRGLWAGKVTERLNAPTPVNVTVTDRTYNTTTRTVNFKVKAKFVDYSKGDYRINAYIIENNVRGPKISATSVTWNQRNYMSAEQGGATSYQALKDLPSYVVGYYHQHVVRKVLSGDWGTTGVIPAVAAEGGEYVKDYTWTIPAEGVITYDAADGNISEEHRSTVTGPGINKHYDMKIVAFVSKYSADLKGHEVLNVVEVPLAWNTGVEEEAAKTMPATVYPNPTSGITSINFNSNVTGNISIAVMDITGKKVMDVTSGVFAKGEHTLYFDATNLNNGVYFVAIKGDKESATARLVIAK